MNNAVNCSNLALVHLFLSHPDINIDVTTELGGTPLWFAVRHGKLEIAKCLLDPKACNIRIDYSLTNNHKKIIAEKRLQYHEKGANPDGVGSLCIPMHEAASRGDLSLMELLFKYGANIKAISDEQKTALMCAQESSSYAAMEWLLQNGADMTQENKNGETCVTMACRERDPKSMQILLKYNCDLSIVNKEIFQLTIREDNIQVQDLVFRYLLKKYHNKPEEIGKILDEPAFENRGTVFHVAMQKLLPDYVHYLTQINANPFAKNSKRNIQPTHTHYFFLNFYFIFLLKYKRCVIHVFN